MTRQSVTVALNGDAGDENFAGYERYAAVKLAHNYDRLPAAWRKTLEGALRGLLPALLPLDRPLQPRAERAALLAGIQNPGQRRRRRRVGDAPVQYLPGVQRRRR